MSQEYTQPTVKFIYKVSRDFGKGYFNKNPLCNENTVQELTNHIEELYDIIDFIQKQIDNAIHKENKYIDEIRELKSKIKDLQKE